MSPPAEVPPGWSVLPLDPETRLAITRDMPALDPALDAIVERHWQAACRDHVLFNGRVFSVDRVSPGLIEGHWSEYRRITAQMADHALVSRVGVRSLAVCGVVSGPDGVVVGRRESRAAYQAGLWQLPPAGSVDQSAATPEGADWRRALLGELREELALEPGDVTAMQPLCLVQHPSGVLDMGVLIRTPLPAAAILARHAEAPDQEYDALFVEQPSRIAARVAALGGELVPPAAVFLRLAALGCRS